MVDYLLGVPGKLKTLLDRWTATKAGYLDTTVSSRASASALTTVDTVVDAVLQDTSVMQPKVTDILIDTASIQPNAAAILQDTANMQPRLASMSLYGTTVRRTVQGSVSISGNSSTTYDLTIGTVTNIAKCVVTTCAFTNSSGYSWPASGLVVSTTKVRVYVPSNTGSTGVYYAVTVVEFY